MQLFKYSIVIARPRDIVFDFFTDWTKAPLWRLYVRSMEREDAGPLGAGSRVRFVVDLAGEEIEYGLTVLAFERPSLWRHRTNETDFDGYIEYRFDEEGPGMTRVTFRCVITPRSIIGWLAMPQMWLSRNRSYREQLPNLKRELE
jgi:uncharacterized protein YndB with AHSA1/START domain